MVMPPSLPELESLRAKCTQVSHRFSLPLSMTDLWPYVSNTDLMNEALELDVPTYRWEPHTNGGRPHLWATSKAAGMKQSYYEFPYEWQFETRLQVERVYHQGLFHYFSYRLDMQPVPDSESGETDITVSFDCVPSVPAMVIKPILKGYTQKLEAIFQQICRGLEQAVQAVPASAYFEDPAKQQTKIQSLTQKLSPLMPGSKLPGQLAQYIYCAPERYVHRLRPFDVAKHFGAEPSDMLRLCLLACKEELLEPHWTMLCTSCWGPKHQSAEMQDVKHEYDCESCGIDYPTQIDQNLELVFQPVAAVRQTQDQAFCAGSPTNTPHIASQWLLWPEQSVQIQLPVAEGIYHLWCDQKTMLLTVNQSGVPSAEVNSENCPEDLHLASGGTLKITSGIDFYRLLRLQNLAFHEHRATAAHLYALHEFHEMFPEQIPAPEMSFKVTQQMMVSLDVKSTPQEDWLRDELQTVFLTLSREHAGTRVKTPNPEFETYIFNKSTDALAFASHSLKELQELQALHPDHELSLNLILHARTCEILNQDQALCYRIQPLEALEPYLQTQGGNLIVSAELFTQSQVQNWLPEQHLQLVHSESFEPEPWIRLQSRHLVSLVI